MIIGEKNTDLKKLTGRLKLRFLTEIGRLHCFYFCHVIETKAKKLPTSPGFDEPCEVGN
jgi:hypothetical protein